MLGVVEQSPGQMPQRSPESFSLPSMRQSKATFGAVYSELALHKAVLKAYTKPLFSWRKALQRSHDGRTLYDFARETPRHVEQLHQALSRRQFCFREGVELHYNLNGKHRTIYLFPWEERIVDLLLYQTLNRYLNGAFSKNSYAYRHRGYGVDVCQHRIEARLGAMTAPVYFIKRDIANFFPSIDHELLLRMLGHWVEPADYLFKLLEQRVRFSIRAGEEIKTASVGVPFGTAIACLFANIYLTPLDHEMEAIPGVHYFRYADDMLVFSSDRGRAQEAAERLDHAIAALKLSSKPAHHRDFYFPAGEVNDDRFEAVEKFRHLGLEFRKDGSIGLSRDKSRKICNLFRFAFRRAGKKFRSVAEPAHRAQLAVSLARDLVEKGFRSVAIIDYYLKHVNDEHQLARLDRWLAEEILSVTFQNGHRKGNFRKLSYDRLREMGLPSLQHRRRLLRHGHLKTSFFVLRVEKLIEQQRRRLPRGKREKSASPFPSGPEAAAEKAS